MATSILGTETHYASVRVFISIELFIYIYLARTPEIGQGLRRILSCRSCKPEQTVYIKKNTTLLFVINYNEEQTIFFQLNKKHEHFSIQLSQLIQPSINFIYRRTAHSNAINYVVNFNQFYK